MDKPKYLHWNQCEPLIDIVYSAWGWNSQFNRFLEEADQRLDHLVSFAKNIDGVHVERDATIETTSGMMLSEGLFKPLSENVYPVGESAGVAKPKSGESFNRTLFSGRLTAQAIDQNLAPRDVYESLKKTWGNDHQFLAFTLARLRDQYKGNTSKLMDTMGKWHNQGIVDERFVKHMEQFIIHGVLSPHLLKRFLVNRPFLETVMNTIVAHARVRMFGIDSFPRTWTLPNISD